MADDLAQTQPAVAPAAAPRRRFLLDRGFQLKYALVMAGAGLLVAGVFGLWIHQVHAQAIALLSPDTETRALIARSDTLLLAAFAGIALLLAVALGLLGVVITHRVAGPVFVMGHYLSVLAQGRFPRMRTLRRSDELRSFFHVFIDAVESMKKREARHVVMLEDALARVRSAAARTPELQSTVHSLETAARERRLALAADDPELTPIAMAAPRASGGRQP
jgi:hypothetical protein